MSLAKVMREQDRIYREQVSRLEMCVPNHDKGGGYTFLGGDCIGKDRWVYVTLPNARFIISISTNGDAIQVRETTGRCISIGTIDGCAIQIGGPK